VARGVNPTKPRQPWRGPFIARATARGSSGGFLLVPLDPTTSKDRLMSSFDRTAALAHRATLRAFGQSVTFAGTAVKAVFDPSSELFEQDGYGAVVRTVTPMLWIDRSVIGRDPAQGDEVDIGEAEYYVADLEDQGSGSFKCRLAKRYW
jgi:hypothetical protein